MTRRHFYHNDGYEYDFTRGFEGERSVIQCHRAVTSSVFCFSCFPIVICCFYLCAVDASNCNKWNGLIRGTVDVSGDTCLLWLFLVPAYDVVTAMIWLQPMFNCHSMWFQFSFNFTAQCWLRGCKNRPAPFPGRMYKATKTGRVCVLYLSMLWLYCCLLGPLFMYC